MDYEDKYKKLNSKLEMVNKSINQIIQENFLLIQQSSEIISREENTLEYLNNQSKELTEKINVNL